MIIPGHQIHSHRLFHVGGKAENLYHLMTLGLTIPRFVVLPFEYLIEHIKLDETQIESPANQIESYRFPQEINAQIKSLLGEPKYVAVRSSSTDEDRSDYSFAGQYDSFLYVPADQIGEYCKRVWQSAFSNRIKRYYRANRIQRKTGIAVIIQVMVEASVSGVAFGKHPVLGDPNFKLINSVYGLGEGLVSGRLNADQYTISEKGIESHIADKSEYYAFDKANNSGTKAFKTSPDKRYSSSLSQEQILELCRILDQCHTHFGHPQDLEFAIADNQIYILQCRPITPTGPIAMRENKIIWDNSNIIESYPGVTTPLTFSFVRKAYERAYRTFVSYLGVGSRNLEIHKEVFANTLGLIQGRIYYNLRSWHAMLALLPGYRINAPFMESMMGVKERFEHDYKPGSLTLAWWQLIKMIIQLYIRFLGLSRNRKAFLKLTQSTISEYNKMDLSQKSAFELMHLYKYFELLLLKNWKAPLLNDFFAMIYFGRLKQKCERYFHPPKPNIHNDLLCGSANIISVQPIHRSIALATQIMKDNNLLDLFRSHDEDFIYKSLESSQQPNHVGLYKAIRQYLEEFGERCIGELKLETISYQQQPELFISVLKSYVLNGITLGSLSSGLEESLRSNAENEVRKLPVMKRYSLLRTLRMTRSLISARENLRFERTRAFGVVRKLFAQMGKQFHKQSIINSERDIFYLTIDEIFNYIEGTAVSCNYPDLIALRKAEYQNYQMQEAPANRITTYGIVYHANLFHNPPPLSEYKDVLSGIGCCPGHVRGKVKVVTNPHAVNDLGGDILVTSSTDPGWVTLFPSTSGIIVERGSLLSHSAIVSREMGIPCIVGVTGLQESINTGDEIEMNGATGIIKIIHKRDDKELL